MKRFPSKQKAIDLALYQNYNHRYDDNYGVVLSSQGDYIVIEDDHPTFDKEDFEVLPTNYSKMDYSQIKQIYMDDFPLNHWESIFDMFLNVHGEILQFLINAQVPIEKLVRFELAYRGYDKDFLYIGFDKAKEIWLVDS